MAQLSVPNPKPIIIWLATVCFLVLGTVVVGGITRLTESGLSIVDWRPVTGALPPLSAEEWEHAFETYKLYPQYQQVNQGMSLSDFKFIFFWEYLHRNLGRAIGLVFFVPFVYFAVRRRLTRPLIKRLSVAFVLGGLQGLLGWYMVKSGLVNMPRVSHYRLAAHLGLALFILIYLFWLILDLSPKLKTSFASARSFKIASASILALVALQIFYGAFTAGLRAGVGYNTFPLMHGKIVPDGVFHLQPAWLNLFENSVTVQFIHRTLGWLLLFGIGMFWWFSRKADLSRMQRLSATALFHMAILQFVLGVMTLIHVVPLSLASLHQFGATVLLTLAAWNLYNFKTDLLKCA